MTFPQVPVRFMKDKTGLPGAMCLRFSNSGVSQKNQFL